MNIIIEERQEHLIHEDFIGESPFAEIKDAIKDLQNGKMIILFDGEKRENEGDFIVCADLINEEHISQMIKFGSGLIYLVIDQTRKETLGLNLLRKTGHAAHNPLHVAFAEPIEAAEGVTTGISAKDRLTTIKAAISKNAKSEDIITPGHILTIVAHPMGLLGRRGHTEASHTLARLAGFENGCAVGCEVVLDNGEMARMPELIKCAKNLGIKICRIKDLMNYIES